MSCADFRLAGVCKDCTKRLGLDQRMTYPLKYIQVSQLPEFNAKSLAGIQFPAASAAFGLGREQQGTTKITYKIAKTVKESIEDGSNMGSKTNPSSKN